jgi:hypothetical protein
LNNCKSENDIDIIEVNEFCSKIKNENIPVNENKYVHENENGENYIKKDKNFNKIKEKKKYNSCSGTNTL